MGLLAVLNLPPAKPAQGSPVAPTQVSPSPATEPDESDPVEEPAEASTPRQEAAA